MSTAPHKFRFRPHDVLPAMSLAPVPQVIFSSPSRVHAGAFRQQRRVHGRRGHCSSGHRAGQPREYSSRGRTRKQLNDVLACGLGGQLEAPPQHQGGHQPRSLSTSGLSCSTQRQRSYDNGGKTAIIVRSCRIGSCTEAGKPGLLLTAGALSAERLRTSTDCAELDTQTAATP